MTNQTKITPKQLLEIAQRVESNLKWKSIEEFGKEAKPAIINEFHGEYEPHRDTERGRAQLMEVIFEITKKLQTSEKSLRKNKGAPLNEHNSARLLQAIAEKEIIVILSMAYEILCVANNKENLKAKTISDYDQKCHICGNSPIVLLADENEKIIGNTELCGPCCFGTAEALNEDNW